MSSITSRASLKIVGETGKLTLIFVNLFLIIIMLFMYLIKWASVGAVPKAITCQVCPCTFKENRVTMF